MLAAIARQHQARSRSLVPAAAAVWQHQQRGMSMRLFEIFSKEKRAENRRKLKEDIDRGHFDDFRDFRDKKGKVFDAPDRLVPEAAAPLFPRLDVLIAPEGTPAVFPPEMSSSSNGSSTSSSEADVDTSSSEAEEAARASSSGSSSQAELPPAASLVCIAFRAGAQPMIEAWSGAFASRFAAAPGASLLELALVEGVVMRLPPFRSMLLREGSKVSERNGMPVRYLYHFGDTSDLQAALKMTNRLTGYVYLVDSCGRLRWRGSGSPSQRELDTLLRVTDELLKETSKQ